MRSEISETPEVFKRMLDHSQVNQAIGELLLERNIKSVLILARGTSDNAAHFLKYLIETQLGLPCGLTSPSSVTIYNSELHYESTLVVAISQSGQSPDLVQFASAAKSGGALVIALTNDSLSPLAEMSDHHLDLDAGPEIAVAASKSYSAQLLLCYLLVCAWVGKKFDGEVIVSEARRLTSIMDLGANAVLANGSNSDLVVLGRGFSYANAREAALKIQETCKIQVPGMSTADYLHGPISALTRETSVLILAPRHLPENSIKEAVGKIRLKVDRIFWIGNGGTPQGRDVVIEGSNCGDEIRSSIVDSISLQRFALELALSFAFDPDAPKGLSKITRTL
jgi:glucosamine--fructose-6-phosphate aminotransferase (isomerizing)